MLDEGSADLGPTDQDVHYSGWEAGLLHELGEPERRQGCELRRLHNKGAADSESRTELVGHLEKGEVPRGDGRNDSDRLSASDGQHVTDGVRVEGPGEFGRPSGVVAEKLGGEGDVDGSWLARRV